MVATNGMHGSETLSEKIFQSGPKTPELQTKINAMLLQFSPVAKNNPKAQEILGRIGSISETLTSIAGDTRKEIVALYMETVAEKHLSNYSQQVAMLELHQRNRVASVLGASNDAHYSQAA